MQKFENVDILACLDAVMKQNTGFYQSDFEIDKKIIHEAAASPDCEDRLLLWLSRPSGTHCFRERDVFLKDTRPYNTWKSHGEQTRDRILAYAVEITGMEDGNVMGNLYELDALQHTTKLEKDTLPAAFVNLKFEDGTEVRYPYEDYDKQKYGLIERHGKIIHGHLEPENEDVLQARLREARQEREKYRPALFEVGVHSRKPSIRKRLATEKAKTAPKQAVEKAKNNELEV